MRCLIHCSHLNKHHVYVCACACACVCSSEYHAHTQCGYACATMCSRPLLQPNPHFCLVLNTLQILVGCSELCGKLRGKREREEKPKKKPAVKPTSTDRTEEDKEDGKTEGQEGGEGEGRKPPEELLPVSAGVTDTHTHALTVWSHISLCGHQATWMCDGWMSRVVCNQVFDSAQRGTESSNPPISLFWLYISLLVLF